MLTIWKYSLKLGSNILDIPYDNKVLSVQNQYNAIELWVLVDPNKIKVPVLINVFSTEEPIKDTEINEMKFVGTVQLYGGDLVYHVFEG